MWQILHVSYTGQAMAAYVNRKGCNCLLNNISIHQKYCGPCSILNSCYTNPLYLSISFFCLWHRTSHLKYCGPWSPYILFWPMFCVSHTGLATAAGCQLVASCDIVVASENARFATPGWVAWAFCSLRNYHLNFHRHSGHGSSHDLHGPPSIFKAQVLSKYFHIFYVIDINFYPLIYREGGFYCEKKDCPLYTWKLIWQLTLHSVHRQFGP